MYLTLPTSGQYADDTKICLDGDEAYLRATLVILDRFYKMFGLKRLRLYGLNTGVTFSSELFNTWDINSQDALAKIEKIISGLKENLLFLVE